MQVDFSSKVWLAVLILTSSAVPAVTLAEEGESSDESMEAFLLDAEVVRIQEMLPGSTFPMALELEMNGTVRKAAYKYRPADLPDSQDIAKGLPLPDSYLYEVAAYRLDRALGLGMVPVAVIRDVHAEGAVIEWISDAGTVKSLKEDGDHPRDSESLGRQLAIMNLFDALISNQDRKPSDQLVTPGDGRLHLLDHSRSFQISDEISQAFLARPASLPRAVLHRLIQLDAGSLSELLAGLVTDAQIESMLRRRDRIVKKIGVDREEFGDDKVFQD